MTGPTAHVAKAWEMNRSTVCMEPARPYGFDLGWRSEIVEVSVLACPGPVRTATYCAKACLRKRVERPACDDSGEERCGYIIRRMRTWTLASARGALVAAGLRRTQSMRRGRAAAEEVATP